MAFSTQKQGSISTNSSYDINLISISKSTLKPIDLQEPTNGVNSTIRTHSHEQDGFIAIEMLRH